MTILLHVKFFIKNIKNFRNIFRKNSTKHHLFLNKFSKTTFKSNSQNTIKHHFFFLVNSIHLSHFPALLHLSSHPFDYHLTTLTTVTSSHSSPLPSSLTLTSHSHSPSLTDRLHRTALTAHQPLIHRHHREEHLSQYQFQFQSRCCFLILPSLQVLSLSGF